MNTISTLNKKSSASPSGIDYHIIAKLLSRMQLIVVDFMNLSLSSGIIPETWKSLHIIPIPKPQSFHYNINNTRPIVLLDTFRKVLTKLILSRLSLILQQHNVLKGLNFCGLKGESILTLSALSNKTWIEVIPYLWNGLKAAKILDKHTRPLKLASLPSPIWMIRASLTIKRQTSAYYQHSWWIL